MITIFKYPLETTDSQELLIPIGAEILTVQVQHEVPVIWAKVNTELTPIPHKFRIFGTGHPMDENFIGKYIGTYQLANGYLIFHLYLVD